MEPPDYPIENRHDVEDYFQRLNDGSEAFYASGYRVYPVNVSKTFLEQIKSAAGFFTAGALGLGLLSSMFYVGLGGLDPETTVAGNALAYGFASALLGLLTTLGFLVFATIAVVTDFYYTSYILRLKGRVQATLAILLIDLILFLLACYISVQLVFGLFVNNPLYQTEFPFAVTQNRYDGPFKKDITASPYVRGKVLYYWWDGADSIGLRPMMSSTLSLTRKSIQPESEDEIGTVVWVHRYTVRVGTYSRGGGAYKEYAKFRIVDLKRSAIIYEQELRGQSPRETLYGSRGTDTGELARDAVTRFVNSLPTVGLND